ncbi:MAG TPA: hypothetical protein VNA87_05595 [Actinomycetota bacterium]|nr:hypothetical protein [Actinomycetota bacterium]
MRRVVRERSAVTPQIVRGGISFGAILTGVVVALGSMMVFVVLVGLAFAVGGFRFGDLGPTTMEVGMGLAIGLLLSQFLAYMWGGYTAGRMGRGAGLANGILVPAVALIVGTIVVGTSTLLRGQPQIDVPFITGFSFELQAGTMMNAGLIFGFASILAMFVGGIVGGILGNRWHTKLERSFDEVEPVTSKELEEPRPSFIDLSEKNRSDEKSRSETPPRSATTVTYPNGNKN